MGLFDNVQADENFSKVFQKTENRNSAVNAKDSSTEASPMKANANSESPNSSDLGDIEANAASEGSKSELANSSKVIDKENESQQDKSKDERTIFVGNVNNKVITDKQAYKEFKDTFSSVGPVESIRFRSIAFSEILPRKAAYIQQKLHPSRDAVNAYIVYKEKDSVSKALGLNAEVVQDHHLRVDSVKEPAEQDSKRSVFIGNLNFEATEEALWTFFEGCGSIESVRIVRDPKTNLGKGFAFVQFVDPSSTQVALMKNDTELQGRQLRVVRTSSKRAHNPAARRLRTKDRRQPKTTEKRSEKKPKHSPGKVLEGQRAQEGVKASLGRKRKSRTSSGRVAKRSRKHATSGGPN